MAHNPLCLGIDIGTSYVKLCQLQEKKQHIVLEHFAMEALPPESIIDGSIINSQNVVYALQTLLKALPRKKYKAVFALSGHTVVIKKVSWAKTPEKDLEKAIVGELPQWMPFDVNAIYFDVKILSPNQGNNQMDIAVVASKKDLLEDYSAVLSEAGLEPVICDVDPFAIQQTFFQNYPDKKKDPLVLVNIGASKTNINILSQGYSVFTRDLSLGGKQITDELQRHLDMNYAAAEKLKIALSSPEGAPLHLAQKAHAIMEDIIQTIGNDIQRSIDFYSASSSDPIPTDIYLSGGSSAIAALKNAIEDKLQMKTHLLQCFEHILTPHHNAQQLQSINPFASVALGLAMRYPGDG